MKRILLSLVLIVLSVGTARAQGYTVIVNAANPASSASKEEIANIFLKKSMKWPHGGAAMPVDQDKGSKVREAFTKGSSRARTCRRRRRTRTKRLSPS
jgi:ABC-type phosphate transport system substrate-binding protein